MSLVAASIDGGNTVGSTEIYWVLVDNNTADRPNTAVKRLEISCADPNAVLQIRYGRTEDTTSGSPHKGSVYFRGNQPVRTTVAGLDSISGPPSFHHLHGTYFVSGGHPLVINFEEPVEALFNAETNTDTAFMVSVKRMDSASSVGYHINTWHEEY